jgi:hypothetical protein
MAYIMTSEIEYNVISNPNTNSDFLKCFDESSGCNCLIISKTSITQWQMYPQPKP